MMMRHMTHLTTVSPYASAGYIEGTPDELEDAFGATMNVIQKSVFDDLRRDYYVRELSKARKAHHL